MSSRNLSVWPAVRDPSRLEILVGIWAIFQSYLFLSATDTPVSWVWLVVGAVVWLIVLGPVATSPVGKRFDAWFKSIRIAGRMVAIVVAAAVIWAVEASVAIPTTPEMNFLTGGLFAIGAVIVLEAIRSRTVST